MKESTNSKRLTNGVVHSANGGQSGSPTDHNLIAIINKFRHFTIGFATGVILLILPVVVLAQSPVTIREVDEEIPTYLAGPPDPNPMFFFGAITQGAEDHVYPYPLYDNLTNKRGVKTYHVLYLENEYVKISILPEIGGRLFTAVDKTNNYEFFNSNRVIKPALIGMIGAWMSGGIEWNIPHHHRASTFIPVQWSTESNSDGSKTIWVGELEIRHRMRWAVGYTLYPGSSVMECKLRIVNRSPVEHTMLCFANVAVDPNDKYQVIFPPSTQYSTGHGKRSFQSWPINNNVDLSWYKNSKNSGSWFAFNYTDDFVAGYDHGKNTGTMSVADHNVVPGKKFWTWGVGSPWNKILAEDGRPYIEIMVGAYSDNQPDYSWLQPYEERSFKMNWYPFRGIDGVKNANLNAAVNLEVKDGRVVFGFYTTKAFPEATVTLKAGSKVLLEEKISINPGKPYARQIAVPAGTDEHDVRASISSGGRELVSYSPIRLVPVPRPVGITTPGAPESVKNDEELFLAGQRIDQFHNPTLDPDPFYREALRRDSGNISANTGMGILSLRNARFTEAEKYFNKALERLTAQYTLPKDVEPFYYLGVALKAQGRFDEAFTAFYKATWKQEWKSPGYFSLAEIAAMRGDFTDALDYVNSSLDANALNLRAYGLKASILRHLNRTDEAIRVVAFAREKCDPLDVRLMAEQWLVTKDANDAKTLFGTMTAHPTTAQETAGEYYNCGLWSDGITMLTQSIAAAPDKAAISPLLYYYLGYFAEKLGDAGKAADYRKQATLQSPQYVFPFQDEMIEVLRSAIEANPNDARADYYLGNLLYDWQPKEATALWEKSSVLDPNFPITWRNLAVAYSHEESDNSQIKAIASLEKAIAIQSTDPAHFAELDKLYGAVGTPVEKRLALLEKNQSVVVKNDQSLGDLITLKTFAGKADDAIRLMQARTFSIWEGATPFNTGQAWLDAHLVRGLQLLKTKKYNEALADFTSAVNPPENLRAVAERGGPSTNVVIAYWSGCAYAGLGDKANAQKCWNEVLAVADAPAFRAGGEGGATRRPGGENLLAQGERKYYQALANLKLGKKENSETAFNGLLTSGTAAISQSSDEENDASSPINRRQASHPNTATGHYINGLGYAGLGNKAKARDELNAALAISPDYLNVKVAIDQL